MANRRMIASNIFEDDWFGLLEPFEQITWIGLITTVADDQGRFLNSVPLARAKLFPYKNIDIDLIDNTLSKFIDDGKIISYQIGGGKYAMQIVHWWRYQNPEWAMPSKYPAPDGWVNRERYHSIGRKIKVENWNIPGGFTDSALPNPLPSALPNPLDRGIEELSREELRGENVVNQAIPSDPFSEMQAMIERITGYAVMPNPENVDAINEMIKAGVLESDITDAVAFFQGNGKLARGPSALLKSVLVSKAKRVQASAQSQITQYDPAKRASEVYG